MRFIELTDHIRGEKIAINLKNITAFYPYVNGTSKIIIGSQVIIVSGEYYWVDETYEQIVSLIKQYEE